MTKTAALDRFDHVLLSLVQRDNHIPARRLAEQVGLSQTAVLRRLRRLRKDGVIAADIAVVRPAAVGLPLTIHVLVSLERESAVELDAFIGKLRGRSEVRQAWYVTGEADFVLLLQLPGMEAYDVFAREIFHANSNVRAFRTIVTMREVVGAADAQPLSTA
ncbi:Lrp/AsnC family transcriptional regulator [Mesorhizobium sp. M0085]|uniref:Lrp/AsnC family transcriptional regulator n=1 Tax=Mesorhizobium sp. M0085 TaxID=2956872 RepID=UPI003337C879